MAIKRTARKINRPGSKPTNAIGNATAELATDMATICANPNHVLAANTAPKYSRTKPTASSMALSVSVPLVTTNMLATDKTQFMTDQASHAIVTTAIKIKNASPGEGSFSEEAMPPRTIAPTEPTNTARDAPARKKFNP